MRFQLTRQHILATLDLTLNRSYAKWSLIMMAVFFVFGVTRFHQVPEKMIAFLLTITVVYIVIMVPFYLYRRRQFIRQFSANPEAAGPIDCEVVNGELVLKTEKSSTSIPRAWIKQVRSNHAVTLLFKSDLFCHIIPAEVVAADEAVRNYIENKPTTPA